MVMQFSQISLTFPCLPSAIIGFACIKRCTGVSAKPPQTVWASAAREFLRRPETPSTETNLIANPAAEGKQGNKSLFLNKLD